MMHADFFQKLDNPAWYALAETHQPFAVGSVSLKRYQKNIVSFFAYDHAEENALSELDGFTDADETFFIIGRSSRITPELPHRNQVILCSNDLFHIDKSCRRLLLLLNNSNKTTSNKCWHLSTWCSPATFCPVPR